jgi:predicted nucleic acid-binding protein
LGKAGCLDLLPRLAGVLVIPAAVVREVTVRKEEAALMAFLDAANPLQIQPDGELRPEILAWDLGSGESQAISLATRLGAARVVLDDLEARRCANSMNLRVIGSLGVVVMAKQKGLIAEAKPVIERLRRVGLYLDDGLVTKALEMVGE